MTHVEDISNNKNGIHYIKIENSDMKVTVTNLGCHIISIYTKDKNGHWDDVVLGYENIEKDLDDGSYKGAFVGRVANRIRNASFELGGETYKLYANNGKNHLHGGKEGFNKKIFSYRLIRNGVEFFYLSKDMEEGYPGNLFVNVVYRLVENYLIMDYKAISDSDTLCNLTNHAYFNLSGGKRTIEDHMLKIKSDKIVCIDSEVCPNSQFMETKDTPFDFSDFKPIGRDIDKEHEQLKFAGGYDHSFLLKDELDQIQMYDPVSGREMIITTSLPYVQVYSGNYLEGGAKGKNGVLYKNRDGVALETQFIPDSIHIEENPQAILKKGELYHESTIYSFGVRNCEKGDRALWLLQELLKKN